VLCRDGYDDTIVGNHLVDSQAPSHREIPPSDVAVYMFDATLTPVD
jgi:hypothetical protein